MVDKYVKTSPSFTARDTLFGNIPSTESETKD